MRTNIELDDKLVAELQKKTGIKTKKDLVDHALRELDRRLGVMEITKLYGILKPGDWDEEYDYREGRKA